MHGLVHQTLKRYVVEKTDEASWEAVRDRAGLENKLYLPVTSYDDGDFEAVLDTVATMSGYTRSAIERDVGRALAPALVQTFNVHIKRDDSLVELLESIEEITAALRAGGPGSTPPTLSSFWIDADGGPPTLRITYRSERDYCTLAHGILEGLVTTYGEPATVTETACVHYGDEECAFDVTFEE